MPKFCANLTMLWNEVAFMDRFAAAAKAGFTGVEYLFPYEHDKDRLAAELKKHGLSQVLHNLPAGDWAKGERGIGCHPDRVKEFQAGVATAIEYATAGFFLSYSKQALDIITAVGSDNLFLQFDLYHAQVMEGDLARTIETSLKLIPHMQLADNPGRNEPGTGEINYPFLFAHMDRLGYSGWVGCEYKPKTTTDAGLGWVRPYLAR